MPTKTKKPPVRDIKIPLVTASFAAKYGVVSEGVVPQLTAAEITMVAELAGLPMRRLGREIYIDPVDVRAAFFQLAECGEHKDRAMNTIRRTPDGTWFTSCSVCREQARHKARELVSA